MRHLKFKNMDSLYLDFIYGIIKGEIEPDFINGSIMVFDDCVLSSKLELSLELKLVGYPRSRWYRFIREYTDNRGDFKDFIGRMDSITKKNHINRYTFKPGNHTWGNCISGISVIKYPKPIVNLHSHTVYLAPTGLLDITFARLVGNTLNDDSTEFNWKIDRLQVVPWKFLSLINNHWGLKVVPKKTPFGKLFWEFYNDYIVGNRESNYQSINNMINTWDKEEKSHAPKLCYLEDIVGNGVYIGLDTIRDVYNIPIKRMRGIMKKEYDIKNMDGDIVSLYRWDRVNHPSVIKILDYFKLEKEPLIDYMKKTFNDNIERENV